MISPRRSTPAFSPARSVSIHSPMVAPNNTVKSRETSAVHCRVVSAFARLLVVRERLGIGLRSVGCAAWLPCSLSCMFLTLLPVQIFPETVKAVFVSQPLPQHEGIVSGAAHADTPPPKATRKRVPRQNR